MNVEAVADARVIVFALVAVPVLIMMMVWGAVTAYRLYRVEAALPYVGDAVVIERTVREAAPVGVREIREEQRRRQQGTTHVRYYYTAGYSHGVPDLWVEDLFRRRN